MVAKGRCSFLDDDEEDLVAGYHEIYFAIDYEIQHVEFFKSISSK